MPLHGGEASLVVSGLITQGSIGHRLFCKYFRVGLCRGVLNALEASQGYEAFRNSLGSWRTWNAAYSAGELGASFRTGILSLSLQGPMCGPMPGNFCVPAALSHISPDLREKSWLETLTKRLGHKRNTPQAGGAALNRGTLFLERRHGPC